MNLNLSYNKESYFSTLITRYLLIAVSLILMSLPTYAMTGNNNQEKPNIVLIMMDNLGWGELGVYGGGILRGAPTPKIDGLAEH